jgi:hypothetical protein
MSTQDYAARIAQMIVASQAAQAEDEWRQQQRQDELDYRNKQYKLQEQQLAIAKAAAEDARALNAANLAGIETENEARRLTLAQKKREDAMDYVRGEEQFLQTGEYPDQEEARFARESRALSMRDLASKASKSETEASFAGEESQARIDALNAQTEAAKTSRAADERRMAQADKLFGPEMEARALANEAARFELSKQRTEFRNALADRALSAAGYMTPAEKAAGRSAILLRGVEASISAATLAAKGTTTDSAGNLIETWDQAKFNEVLRKNEAGLAITAQFERSMKEDRVKAQAVRSAASALVSKMREDGASPKAISDAALNLMGSMLKSSTDKTASPDVKQPPADTAKEQPKKTLQLKRAESNAESAVKQEGAILSKAFDEVQANLSEIPEDILARIPGGDAGQQMRVIAKTLSDLRSGRRKMDRMTMRLQGDSKAMVLEAAKLAASK